MSLPIASTTTPDASTKAAARTTAAPAATTATLNYDNFLKLLLAQMKNQNPTDPMKSTDYMAQLATFSQVEQSVNMNSKLDALLTSSTLSQAGGLVGHTVTSADKTLTGTVVSVEVASNGLLAHLDNGKDVRYEPGMTVY
ncbi:flagellar basal body rod modification protein [Methylobacterium radiotolerans]|uniref:flagellar hook assembly protein FlgD n=1 Tax=Methylobacterium TaxID=407 RepID=UPI000466355B|nr:MULTISPECIES: flagellar hook assembly protein FlgD [Methylobacterium]KIU35581.1 flagellar basal body rod modification protein [Methylobacterium radiotolerans]KZC02587.1 Basal-body rod modification protein FlgD [Methylobacterium radiotolerans]MCX4194267.1 flagellar hook assembly protein FlgD [Methylobacterium organophilum]MDE3748770.1 flagellar hook assembly protein FlgD [Methylobacterium radiotolerans]PVZ06562.1 flagellar basal-body rod modification protein FlgD [Methylobacterium organophil